MGTGLLDAVRDLCLGGRCVGCARPGRLLCRTCSMGLPARGVEAWPSPAPAGLAAPMAAGDYDGLLKAMVIAHKERHAFALAAPLGAVLGPVVADLVVGRPQASPVVLVPVPCRPAVVRARGHDPMLRVARAAARRLRRTGVPASVEPVLTVVARVLDQSGLGHLERAANLAGSMRARRPTSGAAVVLDDVITTGATLREAQRALAEVGVEVRGHAVVAATRRWGPS